MDLDIYTTEMSKSVWDKAFFMDKIPGVQCVIDFGCADGAMIRYLSPLFPDIMFVGYDISSELIDRARKTPPFNANIIYFNGGVWDTGDDELIKFVTAHYKADEICINFSSVLHEVFSSTGGVDVVQRFVRELNPKYITIRDMYCDDPLEFKTSSQEAIPILEALKGKHGTIVHKYFSEYAEKRGTVQNWRDLTQLLMKMQWIDNGWKEELQEDYFAWTLNDVFKICPNYSPVFECRYQLPYLSDKWQRELNWFNPDAHTHAQFILRRDD